MIYDGPDQVPGSRPQADVLVADLGDAINVLLTGRELQNNEAVRLVTSLLDIAEWAGLRGSE